MNKIAIFCFISSSYLPREKEKKRENCYSVSVSHLIIVTVIWRQDIVRRVSVNLEPKFSFSKLYLYL